MSRDTTEQGTRKGRFARSLFATLSEGEGRQEREGGWRGRRTAVVLSDLQRLSLPHSRLLARSEKEPWPWGVGFNVTSVAEKTEPVGVKTDGLAKSEAYGSMT